MSSKKKLLFVITQFYKGGAEVALLNLLKALSSEQYEVDFLIFDQVALPNTVSLISEIPHWIQMCNATAKEGVLSYGIKIAFRLWRKLTKRQLVRPAAYKFVANKQYDIAFSYGEWMSPEFVATKVCAARKAIWIHTDIDKSYYVDEKILFGWDEHYTDYIYVSGRSQAGAEAKYPFLKGRGCVVHNMCDDLGIRIKAEAPISTQYTHPPIPVLVTVANIRPEKNHIRQVEVAGLLKEKGIPFLWLNIGFAGDLMLKQKLSAEINRLGLDKDFLLLGADQNPYRYMARATAVCVLSDYESWSVVITEAKLLGIPVAATKTSGALEQLEDEKTGLLCDFSVQHITDQLEYLLMDMHLQQKIRDNLLGFETSETTIQEFDNLVQ